MQFFKLFKFYDNNCKYLCFAICYPWYRGIIAIGQGGSAIIGTKTNWFFLSLSNAWRGALHVWTQCNYQWWPWPGMVFWWAELCCGVVVLQSCNENSLKIFGDGSATNQTGETVSIVHYTKPGSNIKCPTMPLHYTM